MTRQTNRGTRVPTVSAAIRSEDLLFPRGPR